MRGYVRGYVKALAHALEPIITDFFNLKQIN